MKTKQNKTKTKKKAWKDANGNIGLRNVGLILPTSLCSSQIASMIADEYNLKMLKNKKDNKNNNKYDTIIALPHTEGCGNGNSETHEYNDNDIFDRIMLGHLMHCNVSSAVLLEHGCERKHNDHFKHSITQNYGTNEKDMQRIDQFQYASIQKDGGLEGTVQKITHYFDHSQV